MMKKSSIDIDLICVGSIGKPRGLKGEFFLNSFCDPKQNICNYSNFIIENNPDLKISFIRQANGKFISKVDAFDNVDDIKKYTNLNIFIIKTELPELNGEEYYWHDLVGMNVIDITNNDNLGIVAEVVNYGSNDILEIKPSESSVDENLRKIPYVKGVFIKKVELNKNIIKVEWPKDF